VEQGKFRLPSQITYGSGNSVQFVRFVMMGECFRHQADFDGPEAAHTPCGCNQVFDRTMLNAISGVDFGNILIQEGIKDFLRLVWFATPGGSPRKSGPGGWTRSRGSTRAGVIAFHNRSSSQSATSAHFKPAASVAFRQSETVA
jgi:hypothetical protein